MSQKPAREDDGRVGSLPTPAVNLAARLSQIANAGGSALVEARILVAAGAWYLDHDGRTEFLGRDDRPPCDSS